MSELWRRLNRPSISVVSLIVGTILGQLVRTVGDPVRQRPVAPLQRVGGTQ